VQTATARDRLLSLNVPGVRVGAVPAEPVRRLPSGIAALDALLGGGLPRGHLSEVVGGPSSGRTALLHAWVATATRAGEVAAVIDLPNALDPPSLAQAGADLARVLWVRPPTVRIGLKCAELILSAGGFGLVAIDGLGAVRSNPEQPRGARSPSRHAWPRLAQVTRRAGAAVVILAPRRVTTSCAALALELSQRRARWNGRLFDGFTTSVELARNRFGPADRAVTLAVGERQLTALDDVRGERLRLVRGGLGTGD
jgi:hypothetical protein